MVVYKKEGNVEKKFIRRNAYSRFFQRTRRLVVNKALIRKDSYSLGAPLIDANAYVRKWAGREERAKVHIPSLALLVAWLVGATLFTQRKEKEREREKCLVVTGIASADIYEPTTLQCHK